MNEQLKKIFSVTLALLLGAGIILFAWKGSFLTSTNVSNQRTGSELSNALQVIPQESSLKTLGARDSSGNKISSVNDKATTTTDILARNLIVDYATAQRGMATTTWSDAEAEAVAQSLVAKIELPQAIQYTTKDLRISNDNSDAAFITYGKAILEIMAPLSSPQRVGESIIFGGALADNNAAKLQGLTPLIAEYAQIKRSLLALKTPSGIASIHLRFVQNFTNIENAITSMQKIFSDPAQGLAGFIQYKKEIAALSVVAKEYQNYRPTR